MPKGLIESIDYVEERDGYYIVHLTVNQDEVKGLATSRDEFKVGDEVSYYFHDKWHTGKLNQPKRILPEE